MAKREAFALRGPLVLYNTGLVLLNAYIGYELLYQHYILGGNSFVCSNIDKALEGPPLRVCLCAFCVEYGRDAALQWVDCQQQIAVANNMTSAVELLSFSW